MDKRVELLKKWGCDTDKAIARMLNDEEFYIECLSTFVNDQCIDQLEDAIASNDFEQAYEYAHKLKGVMGNIDLTPMYNLDIIIVKQLKKGDYSNLKIKIDELKNMKAHFNRIMNS